MNYFSPNANAFTISNLILLLSNIFQGIIPKKKEQKKVKDTRRGKTRGKPKARKGPKHLHPRVSTHSYPSISSKWLKRFQIYHILHPMAQESLSTILPSFNHLKMRNPLPN
jgi:hypothetical protein